MSNARTDQILDNEFVDIRSQKATGSAAINMTITAPTPSKGWSLERVEVHLSAAPTTSEDFIIQKDDADGAQYDVVYLQEDLSTSSVKDIVYLPEKDITLSPTDTIKITYTNTDTRTYGIKAFIKPRY